MAITLNSTTPAAQSGYQLVKWQKDMSGNVSGEVPSAASQGVLVQITNYNAQNSDAGKLIVWNSPYSTYTYTLLASGVNTNWMVWVENVSSGILIISPNGLDLDGSTNSLDLPQNTGIGIFWDGSNYWTMRGVGNGIGVIGAFIPGAGTNSQVVLYTALTDPTTFPASATYSQAVAKTAATGTTTYTFKKNGSAFATAVWSASGTVAAWTQASDATFAAGDILELDGPATADATLSNIGFALRGYRY